ncbi:AbrB/MazE/SpoVT family DNA-binding domain-containing protein [Paenibacillus medicaginis]|uniref:AbrB/MazE/SpoVT family DNA-binding domain-containing protein n=1 Tax=Paenibacillus medicaginis TaxID=1470560 RepID=A0ABV5BY36_9BACL
MKDQKNNQTEVSYSKQSTETETGKERKNMNTSLSIIPVEARSTISRAGQITFPAKIMKQIGLKEGDQLRFILKENGEIHVEPVKLLTADELFGMFDRPEDNGNFTLDLNAAREERSEQILKNYNSEGMKFDQEKDGDLD